MCLCGDGDMMWIWSGSIYEEAYEKDEGQKNGDSEDRPICAQGARGDQGRWSDLRLRSGAGR